MYTDCNKIIDFHTHIFPDSIAEKTIKVLKSNIKRERGKSVNNYTDATLSGLKKSMEENGIFMSVILPIVTNPKSTAHINEFALKINRENRNIISFAGIHPLSENISKTMEEIKNAGFFGIKLHPEFQNFYINSPEGIKILEEAEKQGLYTVIHSGADIGMPPPVHCTPEMLKDVLNYVSGKYIIAAHLGGWSMPDRVEKCLVGTNIMFDTAFIKDYVSEDRITRIINSHGSEKIVFGSDSPWENPKDTAKFITSLNINSDAISNILYKNAARIIKKQVD